MSVTTEEVQQLERWGAGGGTAVGSIRCDKCHKKPKFYVEMPISRPPQVRGRMEAVLLQGIPESARRGDDAPLEGWKKAGLPTWKLCIKCARHLTHKRPLQVLKATTGEPTGKTI